MNGAARPGAEWHGGTRQGRSGSERQAFTRAQLDRLGIGEDLNILPWGSKKVKTAAKQIEDLKRVSGFPYTKV